MESRRSIPARLAPTLLALWLAAAAAAAGEPLFRFCAVADTHLAHPEEMVRFRRFLHTMSRHRPKVDFLLMLGDVCGHAPEYLPQVKELAGQVPLKVYPLPGNHDDNYARNPEWYRDVFGRMHYSFDHRGYHFVMSWSQSPPVEWVRRDLAAVGKAVPIVFCRHYPPEQSRSQAAEPWATVLKHPNVKLILSGHLHRHADGRAGQARSLVLDNCSFSPHARDAGSYYLAEAHDGGRVDVRRNALAELKLLEPPDRLPRLRLADPANGRVLRGAVTFRGDAEDDRAVASVQYSVDFGPWRPAEGTAKWRFTLDTTRLAEVHHVIRVRAIDSAGQASLRMPTRLCMVRNAPERPGVLRFQQGAGGYDGCTDATVRRHGGGKSPSGADGELHDLENWTWRDGETEFSEFYIRFDLSRARLPAGAKIARVRLVLHGSRMNGVKSDADDRCHYRVAVGRQGFDPKTTFAARPSWPGLLGKKDPEVKPHLVGKWPYLGGRQIVLPPRRVEVDLTPLKEHVARWLKDPASNHGLVFSPFGASYNFSAQSSRSPIPTLRPALEIEPAGP